MHLNIQVNNSIAWNSTNSQYICLFFNENILYLPSVSPMTNTTGICKLPTAIPDINGGHAGEVIQLLDW